MPILVNTLSTNQQNTGQRPRHRVNTWSTLVQHWVKAATALCQAVEAAAIAVDTEPNMQVKASSAADRTYVRDTELTGSRQLAALCMSC
jgi:hypothetical protein